MCFNSICCHSSLFVVYFSKSTIFSGEETSCSLTLLVANLFCFYLSNCRFGRKPVMFATLAFQSTSAIIAVFSPVWSVFAFFYFITGFGRVSSYVSAFVLGKYLWS